MRVNKTLLVASVVSLIYNTVVLFAVVLNSQWVRTRAAGGSFESFPMAVRVVYFVMTILTLFLIYWLWKIREGITSQKNLRLAFFLKYLFAVSTFMQLISRSSDERWNAIPAFILALTFFNLSKVKQNGD